MQGIAGALREPVPSAAAGAVPFDVAGLRERFQEEGQPRLPVWCVRADGALGDAVFVDGDSDQINLQLRYSF